MSVAPAGKHVVIQQGNDVYDLREGYALRVDIETIQWIDDETNTMCARPGVAMWTLAQGEYEIIKTTQKPKRVISDDEVRYVFPAIPRVKKGEPTP